MMDKARCAALVLTAMVLFSWRSSPAAAPQESSLSQAYGLAVREVEKSQGPEGYWPTFTTRAPVFHEARQEVNTFLQPIMIALLQPLTEEAGLKQTLQRARDYTRKQLDETGLGNVFLAHPAARRRRMRTVVQRVTRASVTPGGAIGPGLAILLGVAEGDDEEAVVRLAEKIARLRIFENDEGKFDRSLLDVGGAALVVSQFTLIADTAKGNRPSFSGAARPEVAEPTYERFVATLRELGIEVATGVFGARMQVELVNDGPVTIVLP